MHNEGNYTQMTPLGRVKMTMDAIYAVRRRVHAAAQANDQNAVRTLMGDLTALNVCLVAEVQSLINELDKMKPYLIKGGKV